MDISMDKDIAKGWFGAAPPDLTLISRAKKPEYLYTYLRTFYQDDSRPYGVNNLVYPNVGMPHVLLELQGLPQCVNADSDHSDAGHCDSLEVAAAGVMSTAEFDGAMYDLVNFLAYSAEPYKQTRVEIGKKVMLFLAIFFIIAWALNREYWKDVH
jgi:ubiquinol-cytochrome c reductase cytochrome b subunit